MDLILWIPTPRLVKSIGKWTALEVDCDLTHLRPLLVTEFLNPNLTPYRLTPRLQLTGTRSANSGFPHSG